MHHQKLHAVLVFDTGKIYIYLKKISFEKGKLFISISIDEAERTILVILAGNNRLSTWFALCTLQRISQEFWLLLRKSDICQRSVSNAMS